MAIKVTKRATNDGARYSISGLTFNQIFRIKTAMIEEEKKMKEIAANEVADVLQMKSDFEGFAQDAHDVFIALAGEI